MTGTNLTGTGSNVGASQESGEPNPTGNAAGQSVWWSWTAPCNGLLSIDATASSFYPLVEVYTGSSLLSLTTAANGGGTISFLVTAGTTYQISLDGYSYYYPSSGNISFNLNFIPAPPNDNFANRITITGTSVTVSGSNIAATLEPNEPVHTENFHGIESWTGSQSVWWTWQAPKSGTVTISTSGSAFSTIIEVYTGTSISTLTEVAGSPQLFPSIPNQLSFFRHFWNNLSDLYHERESIQRDNLAVFKRAVNQFLLRRSQRHIAGVIKNPTAVDARDEFLVPLASDENLRGQLHVAAAADAVIHAHDDVVPLFFNSRS